MEFIYKHCVDVNIPIEGLNCCLEPNADTRELEVTQWSHDTLEKCEKPDLPTLKRKYSQVEATEAYEEHCCREEWKSTPRVVKCLLELLALEVLKLKGKHEATEKDVEDYIVEHFKTCFCCVDE